MLRKHDSSGARRGRGRPPKQRNNETEGDPVCSAGVISINETYTRRELQARLGVGPCALRAAEARGLRYVTLGHRKLYRGEDVDAFLASQHRDGKEMPCGLVAESPSPPS